MTCIIIDQPHPLDAIWEHAYALEEKANCANEEALRSGDEERACETLERWCDAVYAILALPARNMSDCLEKLRLSGICDDGLLAGADGDAIFKEAIAVLSEGARRGKGFNLVPLDGGANV